MRSVLVFVLCISGYMATPVCAAVQQFEFESGMELRYQVKAGYWFDDKDGKPEIPREADGSPKYETSETKIYLLDRQANGSFRVVMEATSSAGLPLITWADLFPDGRLNLIPSAMPVLEMDSIRGIFPLLPTNAKERNSGWEEVEPYTNVKMRFSDVEGVIEAELESPLSRVSDGRQTIRYRLDANTNLPIEIETQRRFDKYKETHSIVVTAKEPIRHDREWLAKFGESAEKYFSAIEKYRQFRRGEIVRLAITEREKPGAAKELIDQQKAHLVATRDALDESVFRTALDRYLENHNEFCRGLVETAQHWSKLAGLPANDWSGFDLEGRRHTLGQSSGKVVVLDFWFRQCSFCIRLMPQVEQVATQFREKKLPVEFFGVSIDEELSDAKHVAEIMKLSYPVLHSKTIAERLGVDAYPTLLVIAPDGSVRGIFVGYNPKLGDDLTSCIRDLLKTKTEE